MQDTITYPATYADLVAVPPHLVAEILYGRLVTHPRPHHRHSRSSHRVASVLGPPFDLDAEGPESWDFYSEPELHLGPHVVVPDVAGWRRGRLADLSDDQPFIDIAPDWVCELLSPSTEDRDRGVKKSIYGEAGVEHYWLLDPDARTLEVFRSTAGVWSLIATFGDDAAICADPFNSETFTMSRLLASKAK